MPEEKMNKTHHARPQFMLSKLEHLFGMKGQRRENKT